MELTKFRVVWIVAIFGFQFFEQGTFAQNAPFALNSFLEMYAPLHTNNTQCIVEVMYFKEEARKLTRWALDMLDSSSKIYVSLLQGNTENFGNMEQCLAARSDGVALNSKQVVGRYCYAQAILNSTRNRNPREITFGDLTERRSWSICIPASCSALDLKRQLEYSLKDVVFEVNVTYCKSSIDDSSIPLTSWIMIYFMLLLLAFIAAATLIELRSTESPRTPIRSVVESFSLITNWNMLVRESPGQIGSVNGIRVISLTLVLGLHLINTASAFIMNQSQFPEVMDRSLLGCVFRRGGMNAVDAFLLLSGLVLARGFFAARKAHVPFSYFLYVVHRIFRVVPVNAFVLLIHMTVFNDLGSGVLWNAIWPNAKKECIANGWKNLLFINNYFGNGCMTHTWYLATDMQLYLIAPVFLFRLLDKNGRGIRFLLVVCAASCLHTFGISYVKGNYSVPVPFDGAKEGYAQNIHAPTETRMSAYLIGLLLGYFLERFKENKIAISTLNQVIGWTVSLTILIGIFGYFPYRAYRAECGPLVFSLFESLQHPLFAAAVGWIIFVCEQGYADKLNRFLSHLFFQVLSKLSFGFFLTHMSVLYFELTQRRTNEYFCWFSLLRNLVFDIVLINLISAAIFLMVLMFAPHCTSETDLDGATAFDSHNLAKRKAASLEDNLLSRRRVVSARSVEPEMPPPMHFGPTNRENALPKHH